MSKRLGAILTLVAGAALAFAAVVIMLPSAEERAAMDIFDAATAQSNSPAEDVRADGSVVTYTLNGVTHDVYVTNAESLNGTLEVTHRWSDESQSETRTLPVGGWRVETPSDLLVTDPAIAYVLPGETTHVEILWDSVIVASTQESVVEFAKNVASQCAQTSEAVASVGTFVCGDVTTDWGHRVVTYAWDIYVTSVDTPHWSLNADGTASATYTVHVESVASGSSPAGVPFTLADARTWDLAVEVGLDGEVTLPST